MKRRLTCAVLALCLLLSGCAATGTTSPQRYSVTWWDVFDTVTVISGYADSEADWNTQMTALHADLLRYNQLYDIYNHYDGMTNLADVNAGAAAAPVAVGDEIMNLLTFAQEMYQATDGACNAAAGAVLRYWHDARTAAGDGAEVSADILPKTADLQAAAAHCNMDDLILNQNTGTVYFADPELQLDVGSIGKGYAVEQCAQAAEARGLTSALLNVGGNVRAIGTKPDGTQWTGGVEDPWNASDYYTSDTMLTSPINISDMALVTSGDYQRYYVVDGKRYHHLIDPDTLFPAAYFNSVTVLCSDSGLADCLTTGLFCMPLEEGQKIVEGLDGVEALWCTTNQQVVTSSGWDEYLKK